MKTLARVVAVLLSWPVFCVLGFLAADLVLRPDFEPVDLAEPPLHLAFLVAWTGDDGRPRCRAFYRYELERHADSLPPIRYDLSEDDWRQCVASVTAFRANRSWPDETRWSTAAFGVAISRPETAGPGVIEVAYPPDFDRVAVTRYTVEPERGTPTRIEFRGSFGPAQGVAALFFGGLAGSATWLVLVSGWLIRRRHRARAD